MSEWSNFFVATAGAAAALTGLIFVGVSINLIKILSFKSLPTRALLSLTFLGTILILSILFLIPKQSVHALGTEVVTVGALVWASVSIMDVVVFRATEKIYKKQQAFSILLDQLATLPYIIGGLVLLSAGDAGTYWIVPAFVLSFFKAVLDAWVLLVEIHR